MVFVSVTIMKSCVILLMSCRRGNRRASKESRKPEQGVKESCDGEKKKNVPPELLLLPFSMRHFVCVGVSC